MFSFRRRAGYGREYNSQRVLASKNSRGLERREKVGFVYGFLDGEMD